MRPDDNRAADPRVPPHSHQAEQALLGSVMGDASAWDKIGTALAAEDFYRREHRVIWAALCSLAADRAPLDIVSLAERLDRSGKLEEAGGLPYIGSMVGGAGSNAAHYAALIREKAMLRSVIATCADVTEQAMSGDTGALEAATGMFSALASHGHGGGPRHAGALMREAFVHLDMMAERGQDLVGISTGFADLDRQTGGLQQGDLVIIAARPSMGKSTLAQNIAEHVADTAPLPVVFFSLEMSALSVMLRSISAKGNIPHDAVRSANMNSDQWSATKLPANAAETGRLFVDDTGGLPVGDLLARTRKLHREHGGLAMVVVDYLQLLTLPGRSENRNVEVGKISHALKAMAKNLSVPVVALSQLSRNVDQRPIKRPCLADLRESGDLEQDADIVAFIYRDEVYNPDTTQHQGIAEINVAKNRNGKTGMVRMIFQGEYCRFLDAARGAYAGPGYSAEGVLL